jgi:surface polysaccharide O-acyltransferase-like enzyme
VGPFAFQLCRPLLYAVYFFAGLGVGTHGLERGFLAPGGWLTYHWRAAGWAALAAFAFWLTFAGIAGSGAPSPAVRLLEAVSYVPCCTSGCLFMLALFVRFANRHVRVLDVLGDKAYGMYLVHYLFSIWLQFLLLGFAAFAIVKAAVVFCGTAALSFGTIATVQRAFVITRVESKRNARAPLPS